MAVKTDWYEADSRFIPGHYQPATLIDLALSRDIDSHRLLRGTGLFHEDILAGTARLSPQQFFALIGNSRKLLDADDSSFLFGQRLLPGYYGAASHALGHAQNLHQALEILIQQQVLLSPLVSLQLELDEHHAYLYWLDSCGAGEHWRFLLEASMTSLVAMSHWLSGQRLPWVCSFSHAEPRYVEQYWVHLGEHTRFERPLDMMCLPRECLTHNWPGASATAGQVARQQALEQLALLAIGHGPRTVIAHQVGIIDQHHRHPLLPKARVVTGEHTIEPLRRRLVAGTGQAERIKNRQQHDDDRQPIAAVFE